MTGAQKRTLRRTEEGGRSFPKADAPGRQLSGAVARGSSWRGSGHFRLDGTHYSQADLAADRRGWITASASYRRARKNAARPRQPVATRTPRSGIALIKYSLSVRIITSAIIGPHINADFKKASPTSGRPLSEPNNETENKIDSSESEI